MLPMESWCKGRQLMLSFKTKQLEEKASPGMKQLVKGFKADGMDDDKAFALAWSIYNKKKTEEKTPTRPQEDDSGWVEEYITEGKLGLGDLGKDLWRWQAFVKKVKTGDPFVTTDGGTVVLDKDILKGVTDVASMKGVKLTVKGTTIPWSKLEKTSEFGGGGSSGEPSGAQWEALICVGVNKIKGKY